MSRSVLLFAALVLLAVPTVCFGGRRVFIPPIVGGTPRETCLYGRMTCYNKSLHHTGVDYRDPEGTEVVAVNDGEVVHRESMSAKDHGMGNNIIIRHELTDGSVVYSTYSHLREIGKAVQLGPISRGTVIGIVGGSGKNSLNYWGPHLHFEMKISPTTGSPLKGDYWGYVSANPDDYGYLDPLQFFFNGDTYAVEHAEADDGHPLTFTEKGACPFECCTYRTWKAGKSLALYSLPTIRSLKVGTVSAGGIVEALTGEVQTTSPGRLEFLRRVDSNGMSFEKEDVCWLFTYLGEGVSRMWHEGQFIELGVDDIIGSVVIDYFPESVWWTQIRVGLGLTGWTPESRSFIGSDRCGGPDQEIR